MEQIKFITSVLYSTLIFVSTVLFLILIFTPIYIYRFVLRKLRALGPSLADIVSLSNSPFATDNIYSKPEYTILICTNLKRLKPGSSNIVDDIRRLALEKFVNPRKDNGELRYPEWKQYPYQWMGFFFWKWVEGFDISNHINFYSSETTGTSIVSQKQLREIENCLVFKPFEIKRSPWEILIIPNVESDNGELEWVILFRVHHILADGFSLLKTVLLTLVDNGEASLNDFITKQRNYNTRTGSGSGFQRNLDLGKKNLLAPFHFTKYYKESKEDTNVWTLIGNRNKTKYVTAVSEKISVAELKEITKSHNVGLTAVIYSGLAAALRKLFLQKTGKVPKNIQVLLPFPMPGHPDKLTNHMVIVRLRLPVEEHDPVERLHQTNKNISNLTNSLNPAVTFYVVNTLTNAIFPSMIKYLLKTRVTATAISSSFPGPKQKLFLRGYEIHDLYFYMGPTVTNFGVFCNTCTYCDGLKLTMMTNGICEDAEEVGNIIKDMQEEFRILRNT